MATAAKSAVFKKGEAVKNLFLSGMNEESIALQLDLEIPIVVRILKEMQLYQPDYISD